MLQLTRTATVFLVAFGLTLVVNDRKASAQVPVGVTIYYPAVPTVTYVPERRGLFGRRIVYRPVVTYSAPVTTYYAPQLSAPVTTYYAPQLSAPVTTYYAPQLSAPVTTFYVPAQTVIESPVTTFYAPSTITTYYPPVIMY